MSKKLLGIDVLTASQERIKYCFDHYEKLYISFSGGKDSTAMLHLVASEAKSRGVKIGLLFIDWECQFKLTIDHIKEVIEKYQDNLDVYWTQFPIMTNNSTSMIEPTWQSFDEHKKDLWTRDKEAKGTIKDGHYFDFYFDGITFEEFVELFGIWYSKGKKTGCFVGIRTQESLNRFRAISKQDRFNDNGKKFTTKITDNVWNMYPIYDWLVDDIWHYYYVTKNKYNEVYDRMHLAGLKPSQMRIDEPFGEEARKNLWIYHILEPLTWTKIVARMNGVNSGALYSQERGNVFGNMKVSLPENHTWKTFCEHILNTIPPKVSEHYKNKIAVYLKWYKDRGYPNGIPDQGYYPLEQKGKIPAWRQIAKALLRNDYWCRGLGFGITKSSAYEKYLKLMKKRRNEWKILEDAK